MTSPILEHKIHTIVVKPLTPDLQSAKLLVSLCKEHNVYGAVDFHKRYDFANLKMKELISQGKIGDPLYFVINYSQKKVIPETFFSQWVDQTDIFQYLGVHYADMISFLTGATPRRVLSVGQKNWLVQKGIDTYDAIETMIEWELNQTRFICKRSEKCGLMIAIPCC